MYLQKIPRWLQWLYPSYLWIGSSTHKTIYLTFDDGPVPKETEWVLDILDHFGAKGTFFWVGENVKRYPHLARKIVTRGHTIGNHTYHHVNGRKCSLEEYMKDIALADKMIYEHTGIHTGLFRPPYGKMKWNQVRSLKKEYEIVMMDVISGDFDHQMTGKSVVYSVKKNTTLNSILLFHDSAKSSPRLRYALPALMNYFNEEGYKFTALEQKLLIREQIHLKS